MEAVMVDAVALCSAHDMEPFLHGRRSSAKEREDHAVTIAEVAQIMDAAFERQKRAGMRRTMTNMFKSRRDGKEFIPLMEDDFNV